MKGEFAIDPLITPLVSQRDKRYANVPSDNNELI